LLADVKVSLYKSEHAWETSNDGMSLLAPQLLASYVWLVAVRMRVVWCAGFCLGVLGIVAGGTCRCVSRSRVEAQRQRGVSLVMRVRTGRRHHGSGQLAHGRVAAYNTYNTYTPRESSSPSATRRTAPHSRARREVQGGRRGCVCVCVWYGQDIRTEDTKDGLGYQGDRLK